MMPGGDMYEQEKRFFDMVKSRNDDLVDQSLKEMNLPYLRIDGTQSIDDNVAFLVKALS